MASEAITPEELVERVRGIRVHAMDATKALDHVDGVLKDPKEFYTNDEVMALFNIACDAVEAANLARLEISLLYYEQKETQE